VLGAGEEPGFKAGVSFLATLVKNARKYPHIEMNAEMTTTHSIARPAV
jgi:hypothetical protein